MPKIAFFLILEFYFILHVLWNDALSVFLYFYCLRVFYKL